MGGQPINAIPPAQALREAERAGTFERGRRVLVAWDGTRQANRALHNPLPLIGGAEGASVIHVGAQQADLDRDRPWLERIVSTWAGTGSRPEESPRGDISISNVLLSRAADLGADMLVAGACDHSRLCERLLGGVGRDLLDHMTVPVRMSH